MKQNKTTGVGYYLSPLGFIKVIEENGLVTQVRFVNEQTDIPFETPLIQTCKQQLQEYFLKQRTQFEVPFVIAGSVFQKKVYQALVQIPYGQTRSYNDVAVTINHANAYRAVGNANNKNNLFLLVPCHRVTRKDGKLSGAKDWVKKQQWLIEFEKEAIK
jgi:O-6-methylguanine DNA methyltransferase